MSKLFEEIEKNFNWKFCDGKKNACICVELFESVIKYARDICKYPWLWQKSYNALNLFDERIKSKVKKNIDNRKYIDCMKR